jgi:hypothetical protein
VLSGFSIAANIEVDGPPEGMIDLRTFNGPAMEEVEVEGEAVVVALEGVPDF